MIESSRARVIIQTNYLVILDILQQFCITSTMLIMRINLCLVRASQFLQQFKLDVQHKPGKEHIILDALNRLANTNISYANPSYSELDALFMYNTTLVKIYLDLVSKYLADYEDDKYWVHLYRQVRANEDLGDNKALLPFMTRCFYISDSDPYMSS